MPTGKPYKEDFKREIVSRAQLEKASGGTYKHVAEETGIHHTLIGKWIKKYGDNPVEKEIEIPAEIFEEFGVDDEEPEADRLRINNECKRESVIVALVVSGYTVWQEQENGDFYIYYE